MPVRIWLVATMLWAHGARAQDAPRVPPAHLAALSPADFTDDELYLPYYLAHFHRLANSVVMTGPNRGFIDIAVWRAPADNKPYNARIMENILSLAFFYSTRRPWNPYYGDAALRARLEAALDFWVRMQSPEGKFSEYAPQQWGLAPTAFATKFMGETLQRLHDAPGIDHDLLARVAAADRKAILAVLTDSALYEDGRRFSNQYSNVWAGGLAYLALYPDAELGIKLRATIARAEPDQQSPVGYFYEWDGPDWGYNLATHHTNLHMAWHYAPDAALRQRFAEETRRWYDWFAYNTVPEPNARGFTLNRAIETRQQRAFVTAAGQEASDFGFNIAKDVEPARVLGPTGEEIKAKRALQRAELVRTWPHVAELNVGSFSTYSPYAFLHRHQASWYPSKAQQRAAIAKMPVRARPRFTHQRADTRKHVVFTYVRRPAYYATFNTGEVWREQQRFGLGLLWAPAAGALLQTQTASKSAAWGTRAAEDTLVYEAASFTAAFNMDGKRVIPARGNRDLPGRMLAVSYPLGRRGRKTVRFGERALTVAIAHSGSFVEQIPLLVLPGDELTQAGGRVQLRRRGAALLILHFDSTAQATIAPSEQRVGAKQLVVVAISAADALQYRLELL